MPLLVSRLLDLIRLSARATFARLQREENVIYTSYNRWLPEPPPTQAWIQAWRPLIPAAPEGCLSGLPALALPDYEHSLADRPPVAPGPVPP